MKNPNSTKLLVAFAALLALAAFAPTAHANVYATNIRINGALTNGVSVPTGASVNISYILNEPATAGVTVKILSGTTVVRTISIASGAGTTKGANSVVWDGKDGTGTTVPVGSYGVSITAAATGYADWTKISDDAAPTAYAMRPQGLAVNKNPNSPWYGRILVGNSRQGPGFATNGWGDVPGIYVLNADGSKVDDVPESYGTGGYNFSDAAHYDGGDNPLNMKVKEDDRVYWNNWVGQGEIVAADMLLTTNQIVMPEGYYNGNPYFSTLNLKTFEVTDITTDHARLYMCDASYPSAGVWWWPMTNGAVDFNDPNVRVGNQAVATGGDLSLRCDGIAIDANTNVYVIQERDNAGDVNMRACCFTNWDMQTTLFSGAAWVVGGADDLLLGDWNMSLDSVQNPKYLALAQYFTPPGGISILSVTNGSTVVTNLNSASTYRTVNWDNVGNLYGGSRIDSRWRAFSPPGANQATTVAFPTVTFVLPIQVSSIGVSGGTATIRFTGASTDQASAFTLESATNVAGPYGPAAGATITRLSAGIFEATVPTSGPAGFYRIKK